MVLKSALNNLQIRFHADRRRPNMLIALDEPKHIVLNVRILTNIPYQHLESPLAVLRNPGKRRCTA